MNELLVVGPSWVGDMVMSQTLFKLVKQRYPHCAIDVLAPAWSLPILARMPEVRRGIEMPTNHGELKLFTRVALGRSLRGRYDEAIVLPNSLKSALVPFVAKIPRRRGWRGEWRYGLLNDIRVLDSARYPLMVQRFAALGLEPDAPLPETLPYPELLVDTESLHIIQQKYHLDKKRPVLALCPGAEFGDAKQWPESHYAAVARKKIEEGWQVWILGSANDRRAATAIIERLDSLHQEHCHNLAGQTALVETVSLLALADAAISNDSGLMHIAAAVRTPLIVIYGSTSPDFTPPLANEVRILKSSLECAPCFKRSCPFGHRHCLTDQLPATVLAQLNELVAS